MKVAVVTLTDQAYYHKARRTIIDVRTRGKWLGDIILITVGFNPTQNFLDYYQVSLCRVEHINTDHIVEQYNKFPLRPTCDNREYAKLTQWDKFYVFHEYFKAWDRIIYLDAGLRVLDTIGHLLEVPCENSICAPDDAAEYDQEKRFGGIIQLDCNPDVTTKLYQEYGTAIIHSRYFLNCIWMYDTAILNKSTNLFQELIDTMNAYPICRCNEMTIMNLIFTFKYSVWKPFPEFSTINTKKHLFGWTEWDRDYGYDKTWRDFCFMKYPRTISWDCD
jgi:alpha-N-acetylglucosamine transferase